MTLPIPIGIGDFRTLREDGLEYVDKSELIRELVDRPGVQIALLPRPRRFGKSLNLSMLRWFFEKRDENLWPLFDGLRISRAGETYRAHFQRYPVVYVSFKATRADRFEVCRDSIRLVIRDLYRERVALLERGVLDEWEKADFLAVLDGSASEAVYRRSLLCLTGTLHRVHGERVIVRTKRKTLAGALRQGILQVRARNYAAELHAAGAAQVHALVVAFDGKRVRVASADAAASGKGDTAKKKSGGKKRKAVTLGRSRPQGIGGGLCRAARQSSSAIRAAVLRNHIGLF